MIGVIATLHARHCAYWRCVLTLVPERMAVRRVEFIERPLTPGVLLRAPAGSTVARASHVPAVAAYETVIAYWTTATGSSWNRNAARR